MQVAYVTRDMEATAASLASLERVGPFFVGAFPLYDAVHRGRPVEYGAVRVAFGYKGDLQYELVQLPPGPSCYAEMLGDRREIFHHTFQPTDEDYDALVGRYEAAGEHIVYHGTAGEDRIRFGFVDATARLGHYLELLDTCRMVGSAAGVTTAYSQMRDAAANWNGHRLIRPVAEVWHP